MRIPSATYRLQVNDDFTLDDATGIVPYLARLGITALYLSPVFEARAGSTHGYDVTDPTRIRESIGGLDALRRLSAATHTHALGVILDIVPNHMAASVENVWWRDVLARGRASDYAHFFDIDWGTHAAPRKLRLPVLGDQLDSVISSGQLQLDPARNEVICHDERLPLRADTAYTGAPPGDRPAAPGDRPDVRYVLDQQHYQLVYWREASESSSYRRFFDIADLIGVRVELNDVFTTTHSLIRELAGTGVISGLRIDHIDGLRDPTGYLNDLRQHVRAPDGGPVYTVVEKILQPGEQLPRNWACEGTTGYEFLSIATGMLIDADGIRGIEDFYRRITADPRSFQELVRAKKLLVTDRLFRGELRALAQDVAVLIHTDVEAAEDAVREVTASLSVYRTYTRSTTIREDDRRRVDEAAADAVVRRPELESVLLPLRSILLLDDTVIGGHGPAVLDWVLRWQQFTGPVMAKGFEDTALYCHNACVAANDVGTDPARPALSSDEIHGLLARRAVGLPHALNATATHDTKRGEDTRARIAVISELPDEWRAHLRRWMREGDECRPDADVDSLLYQTLVGAWPVDGPDSAFLDRIKAYMTKAVREAREQTSWRRPDEDYEQALSAFIDRLLADAGRAGIVEEISDFAGRVAPHGMLNSLAQTLLRITAPGVPDVYQGTELWSFTLVDPDNRGPVDYELRRRLLDDVEHLLDTPEPGGIRRLLECWRDGRIKLLVTAAALRFRLRHSDVYMSGEYEALRVSGPRSDHVLAFARRVGSRTCITTVPRLTVGLVSPLAAPLIDPAVWTDTVLHVPAALRQDWHNELTGETVDDAPELELSRLFATLPLALLDVSQPIGA